jgi:tetratricopeptide (TPR) repeat protein
MARLRERLEGLTAARSAAGGNGRSQPADAKRTLGPGCSVAEEVAPFSNRRWLDRLPAADPRAASLLAVRNGEEFPPPSDWLFLDLETTGLSGGAGTYAFLVGVGWLESEGFRVRQFFLRELAEERALLEAVSPLLERAALLVTYNGKVFDAPVLETRFRLARLPLPLEGKPHLDLLYPARRLWRLRWDSLRLMELERNLLRYHRPEDIPGELIPGLYFDYLRNGNEAPLRAVFRHNVEDVVTLAALAGRALHLAAEPETASEDPTEFFALGRLFERNRQLERARTLYELALAGSAPPPLEQRARYRLSLLCKRQRDYQQAVTLWRELAAANGNLRERDRLSVYEQLAICYEHRLDDREAATEVTRKAMSEVDLLLLSAQEERRLYRKAQQRFAHRLRRLTRDQPRPSLP